MERGRWAGAEAIAGGGLLALAALAAAAGAGCQDGPEDVRFKGYIVTVPADFSTEREGQGPHQTLVLVPPERTVACRLVVIRDSRRFGETDARAFLATGRDRYRGSGEEPLLLETADGNLSGWARVGVTVPERWALHPRPGSPHLEVYAAGRGSELVGMLIGWYEDDHAAPPRVAACRRALATLRR